MAEMGEKEDDGLTKLVLNNFIIKNKPSVQKGKKIVINKLIGNVKQLQQRIAKTKEEDQKKMLTRKMKRMVEEIKVLKGLRPENILKFSILNKKTFDAVSSCPDSKIEERTLCRVAENMVIKKVVENFRTTYPSYEKRVTVMFQTMGLQKRAHRKLRIMKITRMGTINEYLAKERQNVDILEDLLGIDVDSGIVRGRNKERALKEFQKTRDTKPQDNLEAEETIGRGGFKITSIFDGLGSKAFADLKSDDEGCGEEVDSDADVEENESEDEAEHDNDGENDSANDHGNGSDNDDNGNDSDDDDIEIDSDDDGTGNQCDDRDHNSDSDDEDNEIKSDYDQDSENSGLGSKIVRPQSAAASKIVGNAVSKVVKRETSLKDTKAGKTIGGNLVAKKLTPKDTGENSRSGIHALVDKVFEPSMTSNNLQRLQKTREQPTKRSIQAEESPKKKQKVEDSKILSLPTATPKPSQTIRPSKTAKSSRTEEVRLLKLSELDEGLIEMQDTGREEFDSESDGEEDFFIRSKATKKDEEEEEEEEKEIKRDSQAVDTTIYFRRNLYRGSREEDEEENKGLPLGRGRGSRGRGTAGRGGQRGRGEGASGRGGRGRGAMEERGSRGRGGTEDRRGRGGGRGLEDRGRGRGGTEERRGRGAGRGRGGAEERRGRGGGRGMEDRGRGRGGMEERSQGVRGRGRGGSERGGKGDKPNGNAKNVSLEAGGPLHPSWEAKMKQNRSIAKFQGTKIVFD